MNSSVGNAIRALPDNIVTKDEDVLARYLVDFRKKYVGKTAAVLRPRTTAQVKEIVDTCVEHGVSIVPQGGNTSYCGGATPSDKGDELVVSLERLKSIRCIDEDNLSVTVEAGVVLSDLQQAVEEAGMMLPFSLGSKGSCQIGGNISTNAGGVSVVKYGMIRDLVLGLEVVLPNGEILDDLAGLRKDNSGYSVRQLFVGAEGTLGIVTAATLKLLRKPKHTVTAFLAIDNLHSLPRLMHIAQLYTGEAVTSFEYISDHSLSLLLSANPNLRHPLASPGEHYVLMEASTASPVLDLEAAVERMLEELFEGGLVVDGTIAASEQQRLSLWELRESLPEGEVHHGGSVKHDISVETSKLPAFIQQASELVLNSESGHRISVYGHVGDGNVHFNVLAGKNADVANAKNEIERDVSNRIHELCREFNGSFSAEYGIGQEKLALLEAYGDPVKLSLMRTLKRSIDPTGLMNPGKVIP